MTTSGIDIKIQEMAARIRDLREISGFSPEEMAKLTGGLNLGGLF